MNLCLISSFFSTSGQQVAYVEWQTIYQDLQSNFGSCFDNSALQCKYGSYHILVFLVTLKWISTGIMYCILSIFLSYLLYIVVLLFSSYMKCCTGLITLSYLWMCNIICLHYTRQQLQQLCSNYNVFNHINFLFNLSNAE